MWDLPRPGIEPVSPALAGRFFTRDAQRSVSDNPFVWNSCVSIFFFVFCFQLCFVSFYTWLFLCPDFMTYHIIIKMYGPIWCYRPPERTCGFGRQVRVLAILDYINSDGSKLAFSLSVGGAVSGWSLLLGQPKAWEVIQVGPTWCLSILIVSY